MSSSRAAPAAIPVMMSWASSSGFSGKHRCTAKQDHRCFGRRPPPISLRTPLPDARIFLWRARNRSARSQPVLFRPSSHIGLAEPRVESLDDRPRVAAAAGKAPAAGEEDPGSRRFGCLRFPYQEAGVLHVLGHESSPVDGCPTEEFVVGQGTPNWPPTRRGRTWALPARLSPGARRFTPLTGAHPPVAADRRDRPGHRSDRTGSPPSSKAFPSG